MSSVKPFTFNTVKFCVLTINKNPWTRAKEVCRKFEYNKATEAADIVKHLCGKEKCPHKWQLTELISKRMDWPRDSRKDDYYNNKEGTYEILFSSQHPKVKKFRKHCCNVLFPHV